MRLFEGYGIELEYMIVNAETLDVFPVSDEVLKAAAGAYVNEYEAGKMGWSNEFVLHVIELKNNAPVTTLNGLARAFHEQIGRINTILAPMGGRLMPSGMHPWMSPRKEARFWPHHNKRIYSTYDRIFNCKRHGWANVQSMHINISFKGDAEFAGLHSAVRLLLPLIPAIAASSPVADGRVTGLMDTRLSYYSRNQQKVPSVMGKIIPEPVFTRAEYREKIFKKMFADISEHDEKRTLCHEWLNSRGAIPRYNRNALEIRLPDTQECPDANIAVADLVLSVLRKMTSNSWASTGQQMDWKVQPLASIFKNTIKHAENAVIDNRAYLEMFGFPGAKASAGELWAHLAEGSLKGGLSGKGTGRIMKFILDEGTLSTRIIKQLGNSPARGRIKDVYRKLCQCLEDNELFSG